MNENFPAVAILKNEFPQAEQTLYTLLAQMLVDKGIESQTIWYLACQSPQFLGALFGHLVMCSTFGLERGYLLRRSLASLSLPHAKYHGTRSENVQIDSSFAQASQEDEPGLRSVTCQGGVEIQVQMLINALDLHQEGKNEE